MTQQNFPPGAFLIGALRTGSTYLASLLDQHPQICVSDPKEPGYFTRNTARGTAWYRSCFGSADARILIDATAWYSAGPTPRFPRPRGEGDERFHDLPRRIHEMCPGAVFIYTVRDPVERIHSLYWFLNRTGQQRRPFAQAIREDPLYLRSSDYRGQLGEFLRYYEASKIRVVSYKELAESPQKVANDCFRFLGLDDAQIDTGIRHHQRNASYRYRAIPRCVARWKGGSEVVERAFRGMTRFTPRATHSILHGLLFRAHPPIGDDDRDYLRECLTPEASEPDLSIEGFEHVRDIESELAGAPGR